MACHYTFRVRLPSSNQIGSVALESYRNRSGFSVENMRDLQRVFACLMKEEGASEHLKQDNEYFQKVCGPTAGFGARVVVPMSSQGEWRQGKLGWSGLSSSCFLTCLIHDQCH